MIDLEATRTQMLAEIGADARGGVRLEAPTDPRWIDAAQVQLRLRGGMRDELFPPLELLLSARLAGGSRRARIRDLLLPVRSALGNAEKHGNQGRAGASIEVEVTATRQGVLVRVSDEGAGFDVEHACSSVRSELLPENRGAGLRTLERASARVAWEEGGRSVLIGFLGGSQPSPLPASLREIACNPEQLLPTLRQLGEERAAALSCSAHLHDGADAGTPRIRYLLSRRGTQAAAAQLRVVSARLHPSAALGRADFEASRRLHESVRTKRVRIPVALARPPLEPRLVIHAFDPWLDLSEYLAEQEAADALARASRRVGAALRALHASAVAAPEEAWRARAACAGARLPALRSTLVDLVRQRGRTLAETPRALVHGDFGFDCVQYGADGRFYLDRLEAVRRSHPALDLGAFLADAMCAGARGEAVRTAREALLHAYLSGDPAPSWLGDLPWFVASALLERIERRLPARGASQEREIEDLLALCEESARAHA